MVSFLFSVHTITEANQYAQDGAMVVDLPTRSIDLARRGVFASVFSSCWPYSVRQATFLATSVVRTSYDVATFVESNSIAYVAY